MTDHPHLDQLADLAAGVSADAALQAHVSSCPDCSADLAQLARVTADLSALPAEPMPLDVAHRIDAALQAERAQSETPTGTVVPLEARRRPRVPNWLAAAAVLLAAVGGSALLVGSGVFDGLGGSTSRSDSRAGALSAPEKSVILASTGLNYTASNLSDQVGALLTGTRTARDQSEAVGNGPTTPAPTAVSQDAVKAPLSPPGAAAGAPYGTDTKALTTSRRLNALADPTTLAQCLATALGADMGTPLAVDRARFNNKPALVVAYTADGPPGKVDVYVLDPACPEGAFLYWARIAQPTPR